MRYSRRIAAGAVTMLLIASCTAPGRLAGEGALFDRLVRAARHAPLVVAHRGLRVEFPENTLVGFEAALAAGVDVVEIDVAESVDGVLFCMHDTTLDRTTDAAVLFGAGRLAAELTIGELRWLDAGRS